MSTTSTVLNSTTANITNHTPHDKDSMRFLVYVLPVVIVVGLVVNTLSFIVMVSPQMRNTSVYFYLSILSISDSIVLLVSAFKSWLRMVSGFELLHQSSASCKIIFFLLNVSYHTSAWIIVLLTVDRFIAVWLPLKSASVCTVHRARFNTCVLMCVLVLYNMHIFFIYDLHIQGNSTRCYIYSSIQSFSSLLIYIRIFTYCLIPFAAIFVLNVLIVNKLRQTPSNLTRQNFTSTREVVPLKSQESQPATNPRLIQSHDKQIITSPNLNQPTRHTVHAPMTIFKIPSHDSSLGSSKKKKNPFRHQMKLTQILFTISLAWIFLTLPFSIFALIFSVLSQDSVIRSRQLKVKAVCFLLFYTNHSINFFLYCLVGKRFRTRFKAIFCRENKLTRKHMEKAQKTNTVEMNKINTQLKKNNTGKEKLSNKATTTFD